MWPDARLTELFGIEHPIIQAPMKGSATPELAAAVSNAGGLGSLGCGGLTPDEVRAQCASLRALTGAPFNLNFLVDCKTSVSRPSLSKEVRARLSHFYDELELGPVPDTLPVPAREFDAELLETILELRPPIVSFHFGAPEALTIERLKKAGILLLSSATNVREARALEKAGMDAIIAQGWEAGGHRGSHIPNGPCDGVGTMALVPQVVDAVHTPVIAAGGIGDARGIAAAFALGASGVQMGTAFLSCPEAATDARRRTLLRNACDEDTIVTDAITGRSARAVRSRYALEMAGLSGRLPPFPAMYALTGPILAASEAQKKELVSFHLYGQAAALNVELPAGDLIAKLVREAHGILSR